MRKLFIFTALTFTLLSWFSAQSANAQKKSNNKTSNASAAKKYDWSGEWNVPSRYVPATITIKILASNKFSFTIEALNGANTGEISGVAVIKGNRAFFDDKDSSEKDAEKLGCRLTFTHKGKLIDVEQNQECDGYGGVGVVFANEYLKGKPPVVEQNFVERNVFPNSTLDEKFELLAGKDYEKFLDAFHQIYEEDDFDNLKAKVFSACVRGICPWNAGIIMYDEKGNIWAAVMNSDDETKSLVHYYTNVSSWVDKLPKTIEKWVDDKRESNENLAVVYKNKE